MVARKEFSSRVVNYVGTNVEWSGEQRAHHGVVDNDDGLGDTFVYQIDDPLEICDLEQRVGGGFQQDEADLGVWFLEQRYKGVDACGGDMVHNDAIVVLEICEQTVGAAVKVVASDHFFPRLQQSEDNIHSTHARADCKCMLPP